MDDHPAEPEVERRAPTICTIGDLMLDVIVLPTRQLAADSDTPATIRFTPGGQAANVAAWAGFLGARSRLICVRGTDVSSELAARSLGRYGVELRGPVLDGRGGVVVSIGDGEGRRTMASDRGIASMLTPADFERAWVEDADVLHVSGYCLLSEPMAEAAIEAARLAPRRTLDLASAHDISIVGRRSFIERLEALAPDLVFATEAERAAVPEFDCTWVIKLGPDGARFPEGHYPALAVEPVDTTGAGDALAAGYLVGGPELAMQAAANSVSQVGAMPSWAARAPE